MGEGPRGRSRARLSTNFLGRFFRPKLMSTSVSRSCHFSPRVALIELYPGGKVEMKSRGSYGGSQEIRGIPRNS